MLVSLFISFSGTHVWQTYLGGESFAGQYIPYFGMMICSELIPIFRELTYAQRTVFSNLVSKFHYAVPRLEMVG